jgi:hypothetical protein
MEQGAGGKLRSVRKFSCYLRASVKDISLWRDSRCAGCALCIEKFSAGRDKTTVVQSHHVASSRAN